MCSMGFYSLRGLKVKIFWHQNFASNILFIEINILARLPLCVHPWCWSEAINNIDKSLQLVFLGETDTGQILTY